MSSEVQGVTILLRTETVKQPRSDSNDGVIRCLPHPKVNRSVHRWMLKPFTVPWQLGTSGGVVESRR